MSRPGRRAGLVALVLSLPTLVLFTRAGNDRVLRSFAADVRALPVPQGARIEDASSQVGLLTGNGNHCDFVVTLQVRWGGTLDSLRAHFDAQSVKPARPGGAGGGLPAIMVRESGTPGIFAVEVVDAPYPAGLDWRCR